MAAFASAPKGQSPAETIVLDDAAKAAAIISLSKMATD